MLIKEIMAERTVSIVIEVDGTQDAVSQVRQVRSALDDLGGGAEGLGRVVEQSRAVSQAVKDLGGSFDLLGRQRDMVANLEDFFRRLTSGARNAADVFKNIWHEVAQYFERQLAQMAAAAVVSLGGGALLGSGGGLLGLGLPGMGAVGSTPPTLAAVFGLPAVTPVGDVFSHLHGIGPISDGQLALGGLALAGLSYGQGSLLGGLGGLAGGALTGLAVAGPIGAIFGGLIGGIAGLFGGDKKKEHDAAIEEAGFNQINQLIDEYKHFHIDHSNVLQSMQNIHQQMQQGFQRSESKSHEQYWYNYDLKMVQDIEDERKRRQQLLGLLPVPEFQEGGLVGGWPSQKSWSGTARIAAWLHPGEFVMNREAVDRWGVSVLESLNRGASGTAGGVSVSIDPDSARWLEQNSSALEKGIAVVLRRGGAVSRALRA